MTTYTWDDFGRDLALATSLTYEAADAIRQALEPTGWDPREAIALVARTLLGDDPAAQGAALARVYRAGPRPGWEDDVAFAREEVARSAAHWIPKIVERLDHLESTQLDMRSRALGERGDWDRLSTAIRGLAYLIEAYLEEGKRSEHAEDLERFLTQALEASGQRRAPWTWSEGTTWAECAGPRPGLEA